MNVVWESRGEGAPVLLIQGLGYARWSWRPIVPALAERHRVIFFDNRGIGESDKPAGPYTAREMAGDALQVLDEAGVERAHVVGASLGGMIAQELAVAAPQRVDKLVLCCTHPGVERGLPMPAVTVQLFREAPALAPEVALRRFVENALGTDAPQPLVEELVRLRTANPPDPAGWQAQAHAGTTYDGSARVGEIANETLVLTGDEDNVIDWRSSQVLAERLPHARLQVFPGTGHLFFWERPDEVAASLKEFLA